MVRTLETSLTTLDWSDAPKEFIIFPKISVISGCVIPLATEATVPITIRMTSNLSAKEKSFKNETFWFVLDLLWSPLFLLLSDLVCPVSSMAALLSAILLRVQFSLFSSRRIETETQILQIFGNRICVLKKRRALIAWEPHQTAVYVIIHESVMKIKQEDNAEIRLCDRLSKISFVTVDYRSQLEGRRTRSRKENVERKRDVPAAQSAARWQQIVAGMNELKKSYDGRWRKREKSATPVIASINAHTDTHTVDSLYIWMDTSYLLEEGRDGPGRSLWILLPKKLNT